MNFKPFLNIFNMKSFLKSPNCILCISICLLITTAAFSQGHKDSVMVALSSAYPAAHNSGTMADFPKLHPMVVHFPIVFLMLAFIGQIISFMVFRRELSWVTLVLVVIGFIGAYLSAGIFHGGDPNLSLLDPVTRATFEKHEQYANYTVWVSGVAALAKIVSHFFLKRKIVPEIIVLLLLATASYTIAVTGDMGGRLVHIDGVGVQGNKLPAHDDM